MKDLSNDKEKCEFYFPRKLFAEIGLEAFARVSFLLLNRVN